MPNILNKPDQIAKITFSEHDRKLTLEKVNNAWQIVEKNNYPVLASKVDELLYSLKDLRIVEPKTSNKEYFKQLDLNDIAESDSKALLITVADIYNDIIAKVYIGKREGVRLGEEYQEHIFVRRAGEDQAWLVQGILPVTNDFRDWVEQPLLSIIESEQVKSIEINQPSGNKVTISRTQKDQEDFTLENTQAKQDMVLDLDSINTVPFEIAELEFADVHPKSDKTSWDNAITATLETFPGVKVVLNLIKDGDKILAKVHAAAAQDVRHEIQDKVLAFNAAKEPWVYELSPEIYTELTLSKDDFLKPKELE